MKPRTFAARIAQAVNDWVGSRPERLRATVGPTETGVVVLVSGAHDFALRFHPSDLHGAPLPVAVPRAGAHASQARKSILELARAAA